MDSQCPTCQRKIAGDDKFMTKREQFMTFVLVGATARDISAETCEAQLIMHIASQIPEEAIPSNTMNAAKVFLAFSRGPGKRPHRWMLKTRRREKGNWGCARRIDSLDPFALVLSKSTEEWQSSVHAGEIAPCRGYAEIRERRAAARCGQAKLLDGAEGLREVRAARPQSTLFILFTRRLAAVPDAASLPGDELQRWFATKEHKDHKDKNLWFIRSVRDLIPTLFLVLFAFFRGNSKFLESIFKLWSHSCVV
jgi:hypothetical protein